MDFCRDGRNKALKIGTYGKPSKDGLQTHDEAVVKKKTEMLFLTIVWSVVKNAGFCRGPSIFRLLIGAIKFNE